MKQEGATGARRLLRDYLITGLLPANIGRIIPCLVTGKEGKGAIMATARERLHDWNRHHLQQLAGQRNRREAKGLQEGDTPRAVHYAADHERRARRWLLNRLSELTKGA